MQGCESDTAGQQGYLLITPAIHPSMHLIPEPRISQYLHIYTLPYSSAIHTIGRLSSKVRYIVDRREKHTARSSRTCVMHLVSSSEIHQLETNASYKTFPSFGDFSQQFRMDLSNGDHGSSFRKVQNRLQIQMLERWAHGKRWKRKLKRFALAKTARRRQLLHLKR